MRIEQGCVGVAVGAPRVVRSVRFALCVHYLDDTLAHRHRRRFRGQHIRTGPSWGIAMNVERLHYLQFVPDILVALQLHRSWRVAHPWGPPVDLSCPTRSRDAVGAVFHRLRSTNFADWIAILVQILAGSSFAP